VAGSQEKPEITPQRPVKDGYLKVCVSLGGELA